MSQHDHYGPPREITWEQREWDPVYQQQVQADETIIAGADDEGDGPPDEAARHRLLNKYYRGSAPRTRPRKKRPTRPRKQEPGRPERKQP